MKLLLDTHLVLWAAGEPGRFAPAVREMLEDAGNILVFSAVSLWEITIKSTLGRTDFQADARVLRRGLLDGGWEELSTTGAHAVATARLPPIHRDPFDRMLLAQADVEGIELLTTDATVARYPCPVRLV